MQQTPKQIKSEQRSMMLAMILIIAVLFGFQYLKKPEQVELENATDQSKVSVPFEEPQIVPQKSSLSAHLTIESDSLRGQVGANGGVFDNLL